MKLTPKQQAVNKIKFEIAKDILKIVEMAKHCGYGELLYYLHYFHFLRILPISGNVQQNEQQVIGIYVRQVNDAYKYIIQALAKYCKNGYQNNPATGLLINIKIVQLMTKVVLSINSKFETLSFLTMFNNIEVSGERNQHLKVNMEDVIRNERMNKFFYTE